MCGTIRPSIGRRSPTSSMRRSGKLPIPWGRPGWCSFPCATLFRARVRFVMLASERLTRLPRRLGPLFRRAALSFLLFSLALGGVVWGQDLKRKVIARTAPSYPELARRMHLSGKVKLELVIAPGGSVKSAKLVGGNLV